MERTFSRKKTLCYLSRTTQGRRGTGFGPACTYVFHLASKNVTDLFRASVANVDPVGRQEDKNLYLYIEAPGEPSKSAKSKKSVRYQELKIKFPSQKGKSVP